MELANLESLIKSRRSIRRWQDKKVSEDLLLQAIELATWAPNGGNQQNWRFYIILNQTTIRAIADAVQDKTSLVASWLEAEDAELAARMRERGSFFRDAPAAIAVAAAHYQTRFDQLFAAREETDPLVVQMRRGRDIANTRIQSVSSAIAYLLLILHQMGLGAVWMTGPMQAKEDIEKILRVPPEMDIIAFIPVGYPAESPISAGRKPVSEVCEIIR